MSDADDLNSMMLKGLRVRAGSDPRWRRFGDVSEMGVLSGIRWATYLAGIGVGVRRVPGAAWALDVVGGEQAAIIACPCGREANARAHDPPTACECGRSFFFDGEHVFCFNSPEDHESLDRPEPVAS